MAPLLPSLAAHARNLLSSARSAARSTPTAALSELGPLAARSILTARDDNTNSDGTKVDPHKGVVNPHDINNTFVFVVFGLIGAAFVCAGIWFFFWAKNGGFHFKENDWDDYKSTVLRRKGPNGTLLSGATATTKLGGGSVYKDVDDGATEYTGGLTQMTGHTGDTQSTMTGITAGASDIAGRERRRQKRERKEREREKKKDRKNRDKSGRRVGEDGVLVDEDAEAAAKDQLRAYRHEKAARVGGINKQAEGSSWDGSTAPDNSTSAGSDLLSNRQSTPTNTPTKKDREAREAKESKKHHAHASASASNSASNAKAGGIRKVYSTADRTATRENERLRAEARRQMQHQDSKGRSSGGGIRRDFSFQRAAVPPTAISAVTSSSSAVRESTIHEEEQQHMAGGWAESEIGSGTASEVGTKAYHHVIPGLSPSTLSGSGSGNGGASSVAGTTDYQEEKRKKRAAGKSRR